MRFVYTKRKYLLFVLPVLLFFTLFEIAPLIRAFYLSFTKYPGYGIPEWVGLKNYVNLLKDKYMWLSMKNTFIMMLVSTIVGVPVSFLLAVFLQKATRKNTIYKTIFFIPYIIPGIIVGLIWLFVLDPSIGLINTVLTSLGLESLKQMWIGGMTLSPYSIGFVMAWMAMGFNIAIWMTGLNAIPNEVLESSEIDGASRFQQMMRIKLPMVKGTFKIILLFSVLNGFKVFDLVYQLTGGGPNHASESVVSYMYTKTFAGKLYGYGIAIACFMFLVCMLLSVIIIALTSSKDE